MVYVVWNIFPNLILTKTIAQMKSQIGKTYPLDPVFM
jgi:hypothetical protein